MIFIVQHLTKLQIFTKIGMHSKNSTKASFTTYNSRSVAMKPNPYLQYFLVQNKALKSCWSSNLTHRPPHLLMLSNLLILIANIYSFIFHVYFRVRCAFPMFFPSVCKSISISSVFYRAVGTFLGYGNFKKKAELRLSSTPKSFRTVLSLSILWTAFTGPWGKNLAVCYFSPPSGALHHQF